MADPKKNPWPLVIKIVLSLTLLGLLVAWSDPEALVAALSEFRLAWGGVALGAILLSVLISAWKWGLLVNTGVTKVSFGDLVGTYVAGLFFNNFLPSSIGGDGARILLVKQRGLGAAPAAASVVVERTLATASLGLLGLGTGLAARHRHDLALILLGLVFVAGTLLSLVLLAGRLPRGLAQGKGKIARALQSFVASTAELATHRGALAASFGLSILFQVSVALVVAALFPGLGLALPPLVDLVFVVSASSVLAMVPLGLNGYGLREGAYVVLLAPYGVAASQAIIISVLFALAVSVFSLPGSLYWLFRRSPAAPATGEATEESVTGPSSEAPSLQEAQG